MKKKISLKVGIIMGSQSDYKTMKLAEKTLKNLGVKYETKIVSAHRTPKRMYEFAQEGSLLYPLALIDIHYPVIQPKWFKFKFGRPVGL